MKKIVLTFGIVLLLLAMTIQANANTLILVSIDIKPGSCPNSINLKSNGVVPVAVETTDDWTGFDDFDATTVDPASVVFAGAMPVHWAIEDVNGDGSMDMIFHFKIKETNLTPSSTDATLTGQTMGGQAIEGTSSVNIVPKAK